MMRGTHNVTLTHCNMMRGTHNVTLTHCNMMHGTHTVKLICLAQNSGQMWRKALLNTVTNCRFPTDIRGQFVDCYTTFISEALCSVVLLR